jgi:hypothetical protein
VETNQELRDYCISLIPGALAYARFDDVPADSRFDLALLMGNGLGVFGDETATRHQLQRLLGLLAEGGCVLIETGNFSTGSFRTVLHEIEYGGIVDGPFSWGYATREWLQGELVAAGFDIVSLTHSYGAGPFFILHAKKCA